MYECKLTQQRFAVIGNPVQHSLSPLIHGLFAKQTNRSIQFDLLEAGVSDFTDTVQGFRLNGGKGLSVTSPFKELAFKLCDNVSERALQAKAVNFLHFIGKEIFGDNTDGVGFVRDLAQNLKFSLKQKRILILGAGGAVRGILGAVLALQPKEISFLNRHESRAKELINEFGGDVPLSLEKNNTSVAPFDLIINCTSSEIAHVTLNLSASMLHGQSLCYDLKYTENFISFLQWSRQNQAKTQNGLGMLVEQAAEAFFLWHQVFPCSKSVLQVLRKNHLIQNKNT